MFLDFSGMRRSFHNMYYCSHVCLTAIAEYSVLSHRGQSAPTNIDVSPVMAMVHANFLGAVNADKSLKTI